jgi:hypothetical protein
MAHDCSLAACSVEDSFGGLRPMTGCIGAVIPFPDADALANPERNASFFPFDPFAEILRFMS